MEQAVNIVFVYPAIGLLFRFGIEGNVCFYKSGMSNGFYYIFYRAIYARPNGGFGKA
jgi:hypothetical protein